MKELSIEQKAQAYDEALKVAKGIYAKGAPDSLHLEKMFPELKESEDKRIRKEIIDYISTVDDKILIPYESWIAWLEKQGEQKSVNDLTPQEAMDIAIAKCFEQGEQKPFDYTNANIQQKDFAEQKPVEWSEEDEKMLNSIIEDFGNGKTSNMLQEYWLKFLKCRVQPKQEWSEDDEVKINRIVACLENLNVADNDILLKDVAWLKSLRPQDRWKPSDEQMGVIEAVINNRSFQRRHLNSLYEQLKKLREE